MKIIHTADIHLGSAMDSKFSKTFAAERKRELRDTFKRMVEYAKTNGVSVIILAGDVFDSDVPYRRDRDFFYSVVRNNPEIDFLYLRGNHDVAEASESYENLKTFDGIWTRYSYGNVNIVGTELSKENSETLYSTLLLPEDGINIAVLHGQIGDEINLTKLKNRNIDYLALGHVHKPQGGKLDDRGTYAYCGCLEGRGFDEPGEHGFILIDTDGGISEKFVPFAQRKIISEDVDVSGISDSYSAYLRVKEKVDFSESDIYRINLYGKVPADAERFGEDVANYLKLSCEFLSVKDLTERKIDPEDYINDKSLRGEFIRTVFSADEFSDGEKNEIINCGLRALAGKEIEF